MPVHCPRIVLFCRNFPVDGFGIRVYKSLQPIMIFVSNGPPRYSQLLFWTGFHLRRPAITIHATLTTTSYGVPASRARRARISKASSTCTKSTVPSIGLGTNADELLNRPHRT